MSKIYIIGDCHTTRVQEQHILSGNDLDITFWGKAGASIARFDPAIFTEVDLDSSWIEHGERETLPEPKTWKSIKDDGIVVLWLGYIDAKNWLHMHKNAEEITSKYFTRIKKAFPNSKIIIVEPHPQFVEDIFLANERIKPVSYENRSKQNDLLCNYIKIYAEINGIKDVITQKDILNAIDRESISLADNPQRESSPIDALDGALVAKIYELFVDKITEVQA